MAVIREAWEMYKAHWKHFIPLAFVFFVLLSLVTLALTFVLGWLGALASLFVILAGVFWLQGALVEAVADVRDGRVDLTIAETFSRARPHIFTLLAAAILAAIGIMIGLVLLIIPGLVLLTWWCLIAPVIVLERVGITASFGRSRELVRGHGWNVFAVILLTFLILIVVRIVVGLALLPLPAELEAYIGSIVSNSLFAPFVSVALTLMYYRLARLKAGVEPTPEPAV